jgi:hypothetical protein
MNPVRSVKNQYRGVNAHLHSYWQETGWNNFHNAYIGAMTAELRRLLLPRGYTALMEESIQIRRGDEYARHPQSDVTIYDFDLDRSRTSAGGQALSGLVLPLKTMLAENPVSEKPYYAVYIAPRDETAPQQHREMIAWIEVLSPSNKRRGEDRDRYLSKREDLIDGGLVFIEIDYLHELPPTLSRLPDYTRRQPNAHPYRILLFEPRPTVEDGLISINEFDVDQPFPQVTIPLSGSDVLHFNFGVPYIKLYEEMVYGLESVDYTQLPPHFDRYSPADQARIAARMVAVLRAARAGADLEAAPLPVEDISLEMALAEISQEANG